MSTPEPTATTDHTGQIECCGCCVTTEAEVDRWEMFHAAKDLAFIALLLWVLRMATYDLSGGWAAWSYVVLGALGLAGLEALARLAGPGTELLVRMVRTAARRLVRAVRADLRRLSGKESRK